MKKHIVIVGGGFAGTKAALELADSKMFNVTLISDHADFRYYPALYHTAAGGKRILSSLPLEKLFHGKDITIVQDVVTELDRENRIVRTAGKATFSYDSLILALGATTNYFNIEGLAEYSYGVKSNHDAEELKKHLHQHLIDEKRMDHNYVVVGGGPTGIEVAGAMVSYMRRIAKNHGLKHTRPKVELVEAAPRLLPRMPKPMSRAVAKRLRKLGVTLYLNTTVKAETADELMLENRKLLSKTVVWTAGVTNHSFFAKNNFQLSTNGKVRVNQYLEAEPNIYVLGDNADTPYSGMAQTAIHDGHFVANNFIRDHERKEKQAYHAVKPAYVIPVGDYWAAVMRGKLELYGILGWALRRIADLIGYHDFEPWVIASNRWKYENDSEEPCPVCSNL